LHNLGHELENIEPVLLSFHFSCLRLTQNFSFLSFGILASRCRYFINCKPFSFKNAVDRILRMTGELYFWYCTGESFLCFSLFNTKDSKEQRSAFRYL